MSKESLDYQKLCSNYYSSWEEGCCMESCEFYNHNECPVVYVNGLIADLEAKLAEKDRAIENWQTMYQSVMQSCHNGIEEDKRLEKQLAEYSKHHEWVSEFLERYKIDPESTPEYSKNPMIEYCEQVYDFRLCDDAEIKDLKESLAEYKKDNEQLEDRLHTAEQETLHFQNKYFDMQQQLAEKNKEIEELRFQARNIFPLVENLEDKVNHDKISFAVDVLEEIADCLNYINSKLDFECASYVSEKAIRDKIKYLKGKKDE